MSCCCALQLPPAPLPPQVQASFLTFGSANILNLGFLGSWASSSNSSTTLNAVRQIAPRRALTVVEIFAYTSVGVANDTVFEIFVNGVASGATVTILTGNTAAAAVVALAIATTDFVAVQNQVAATQSISCGCSLSYTVP